MRKICALISDEWKHEGRDDGPTSYIRKVDKMKISASYNDEKLSPTRYRDNPPSYIFPKEPSKEFKGIQQFMEKSLYRKQTSQEEDPPIVVKKQVKESYIHESAKKQYQEPMKMKGHIEDDRKINGGLMRQQSERYRHATDRVDHSKYTHSQSYESYEKHERENLTDRQKYREIVENKKFHKHPQEASRNEMPRASEYRNESRDYSPERLRTIQRKSKSSDRFEPSEKHAHERNKHMAPEDYVERNPYREPQSIPYHESIENMMKSPVMKYKARPAYERSPSQEKYSQEMTQAHDPRMQSSRKFSNSLKQEREVYIKESSPMSTMKRSSPKDRFQDAKEKFQAMEKIRLQQESRQVLNVRRSEPMRYEKEYRSPEPRYHAQQEWSSEEEFAPNVREYRDMKAHQRHQQKQRYMTPAKSLGNLTKGYRHSYAEPTALKYCNRVGLAAIEPY